MSARARSLAERCFAVARSATFAGERDAAIARGTVIADKAGLPLDVFDIPGRARVTVAFAASDFPVRTGPTVDSACRAMRETLERRARETDAADDETVYAARRRAFDRATAAARVRDEARRP